MSKKKVENKNDFYYLFEIGDIVSVLDEKGKTSIGYYGGQTERYIVLTEYHIDDPYYKTWKKEGCKPQGIYYKSIDKISMG